MDFWSGHSIYRDMAYEERTLSVYSRYAIKMIEEVMGG